MRITDWIHSLKIVVLFCRYKCEALTPKTTAGQYWKYVANLEADSVFRPEKWNACDGPEHIEIWKIILWSTWSTRRIEEMRAFTSNTLKQKFEECGTWRIHWRYKCQSAFVIWPLCWQGIEHFGRVLVLCSEQQKVLTIFKAFLNVMLWPLIN